MENKKKDNKIIANSVFDSSLIRPSLKKRLVLMSVLMIVVGGLLFLNYYYLPGSSSSVKADSPEKSFELEGNYLTQIKKGKLNLEEKEKEEKTDKKKKEVILSKEEEKIVEKLLSRKDEERKALFFPKVHDRPPPSDIQSWNGRPPKKKGKVIQIILSSQRLLVWEDGELLGNFLASTGKLSTATKQGNFKVRTKLKMAYGSGDGDSWAMPYWLGFYTAGGSENGIHALPYINGIKESASCLGHMVSHGCVRIADRNQKWLYHWANIGTPVIVQWS